MKRNFILSIFMIITLLIANISFAAETPKAELTITADKTTIESTDKTIEVTITLGNISGLATTENKVFLAYEGTIEYDTNMFEAVTVKGQNDWSATYGPTTKKIIGDTDNAKANTIIAKLIFTLKDSIAEGSIPKAGLKNIIVLAALMIVITGIFSFARYKMIKLK